MGDHHYSHSFSGAWVHIGPWMNHNNSALSTITFTTTNGAGLILVSFMTAFIAAVGSFTWSTMCYLIHQYRARDKERDGQHHQEQVLLRNSSDDKHMMWEIIKVGNAWKTIASKSKRRTLTLLAVAIVHFAIFAVAANLSSRIYIANNDVLIKGGSRCGFLAFPSELSQNASNWTPREWEYVNAADLSRKATAQWALSYSRSCYGPNPGDSCHIFPVSNIMSTNRTVPCPFNASICADPAAGFQVDSGWINTAQHLGINSRYSDSLNYRRVLTCSPLQTRRYRKLVTGAKVDADQPYDKYMEYYLGTNLYNRQYGNATFRQSVALSNLTNQAYPIQAMSAILNNENASLFDPIPELKPDYPADVTLVNVNQNMIYFGMVDDLFYNATLALNMDAVTPEYTSPYYNIIMGCTEQHQICGADGGPCTPLTGIQIMGDQQSFRGNQLVVGGALYRSIVDDGLFNMVASLGSRSLMAYTQIPADTILLSNALPTDYWKQEVMGWQQYMLANLQRTIINIAAGPTIDSVNGPNGDFFNGFIQSLGSLLQWNSSTDVGDIDLCKSMRTVDANFTSVHIIGIVVTVVVGLLLILLDMCLPTVVGKIQKKFNRGTKRRSDWIQDNVVQIQRHAFEKHGVGRAWSGHEEDVPVTGQGERWHSLSKHLSSSSSVGKPAMAYSPAVVSPTSPVPPYSQPKTSYFESVAASRSP